MGNPRFLVFAALCLAVLLVASSLSGAAGPPSTDRVSVDSAGNQGNGNSVSEAVSADGRYMAFDSNASNLVLGDTNGVVDVFVHDRQTGATERASVSSVGGQVDDASISPALSGDGRYVGFSSWASNLVPGDTNGTRDIFVHDRQTGMTERVSVDSAGNQGNGLSSDPAISADGRWVAFCSVAPDLVPGDTNTCGWYTQLGTCPDIFVHDRLTGATERVSVDSAGTQADGGGGFSVWGGTIFGPSISADGRYVAYESSATNLVPGDTNEADDVFVRDQLTGATERVSVDSYGGQGNAHSYGRPAISGDGRYVAFRSSASNLVPGDTNGGDDVFVHDRQTGATERVSVDSSGNQAEGGQYDAGISPDGRFVAFSSWASDLVPGDTNWDYDVFVHDRQTGTTERVSVDSASSEGDGDSYGSSISADGRYVPFYSFATNLVPDDTNGAFDVFVRDVGDADGDGEWDPFDPCPTTADCDGDGFQDGRELYLSTDPLDACPDDLGDDAWPLDVSKDAQISVVGDVLNFRDRIGATPGAPNWRQRLDLSGDGQLSVVGDVLMYRGRIGETCT